jgi:hypothetical protein
MSKRRASELAKTVTTGAAQGVGAVGLSAQFCSNTKPRVADFGSRALEGVVSEKRREIRLLSCFPRSFYRRRAANCPTVLLHLKP